MYSKNVSGEFLADSQVLGAAALVTITSPVDILGAPMMRPGSLFEAVQIQLGSPAAFDVSRDNANWATTPAGIPVIIHAVRMLERGVPGGTVTVPNLYVRGAGTIGILIHGDVRQPPNTPPVT